MKYHVPSQQRHEARRPSARGLRGCKRRGARRERVATLCAAQEARRGLRGGDGMSAYSEAVARLSDPMRVALSRYNPEDVALLLTEAEALRTLLQAMSDRIVEHFCFPPACTEEYCPVLAARDLLARLRARS